MRFLRDQVRPQRDDHEGQHHRLQRGLELRRDHRGLLDLLRDQAGHAARRAPTATSPATSRCPTAWSPPRSAAGCRCSSAPTRSRRPPTSCTSCPSTSGSACARSRPRTRSPAVGAALGASYGGSLAVTSTSGPGLALKQETIGLGVSLELPLIIIDVQRAGPSTGMPTKTEQADLLQAMFGRNGESPVPIVAPRSPADCFDTAIEAARIATTYRMPVILLSDGYLANGSEPWRIPDGRRPARPARRVRDRAQQDPRRRDHGVLALPARPRDAGPAVGDPRHGRARAPHRRHREGRRHRQHLLRPRQPRLHGAHPPGQGRPGRRDRSRRSRSRTRAGRRGCWCSAGARPTARSAPPAAWCARTASTSRRPTCATSTRSRATSARSCTATTRCWCRR